MLYIWVPSGTESWRYCVTNDPQFASWQQADNLDQLLHHTQTALGHKPNSDAVVFFPSVKSQVIRREMSATQFKKMGDVGLRYVLEEFALTPIEQLDMRAQHGEGSVTLLSMPLAEVQLYLDLLRITGWRIQALLPDFLLLPLTPDTATYYADPPKRLVRIDASLGYDADGLEIILPRLPAHVQAINVMGSLSSEDHALLANSGLTVQTVPVAFDVRHLDARHPYNMLARRQDSSLPAYWKVVAAVVLVMLGVQMLYDGVRTYQNTHQTKVVRAQAETYFKQWFPDERPKAGATLKKQLQAHLKSTDTAGNNALTLMSRVAPVLAQNNVFATVVNYKANALDVTVNAPNMPALDILKTQLTDQGLKVSLSEANAKGSEAVGTLHIQL